MNTPIDLVLQRVPGAKKAGAGWRAPCPSCGADSKSAKLAMSESADGRVLLHCFAGCAAGAVLNAIGLTLGDLFDRPATAQDGPTERRHRRVDLELADVRAAAAVLDLEACVLQVAAEHLIDGNPIIGEDRERLALAATRIDSTLARLRAGQMRRPKAAA